MNSFVRNQTAIKMYKKQQTSGLQKAKNHTIPQSEKKFQSAYINNIKQKAKHNTHTQKYTKNFSTDSQKLIHGYTILRVRGYTVIK